MGPVLAPQPEGQGSWGRLATSKLRRMSPLPTGERLVQRPWLE